MRSGSECGHSYEAGNPQLELSYLNEGTLFFTINPYYGNLVSVP